MLIIIDANVAHKFTANSNDARAVINWLKKDGKLSAGGLNLQELLKTRIGSFVQELKKSGRMIICPSEKILLAQSSIDKTKLKSDDPHVLALAVAGGGRILFSLDQPLIHDFTSPDILPKPRGKCYKNCLDHIHLLQRT